MNREQLTYFSIAYRTHSFAEAARLIPMSPQGFAKSMRALENELGVPLFNLNAQKNEHVPTVYADSLIGYVDIQERSYQHLQGTFRQLRAAENSEVLLGSSLGIMGFLGSDFFQSLKNSEEGITLSYQKMSDSLCDEGLHRGLFNIAFTLAPYDPEFETVEVYSTPVCLWVNEQNPLSSREVIDIADLEGYNLALPGKDFKCHSSILGACEKEGVRPASILESSEMFWLYDFALENNGLAFSAGHLGKLPFFDGKGPVKCIPLSGITWRFGISILPKHKFTEAEKRFYMFCLDYFKGSFSRRAMAF